MCYYDCIVFACRDWKWGNFRQHCQKEYRIGETCGSRLIATSLPNEDVCTTCAAIKRKENRYNKTMADYNRWRDDPKRQASAEKAAEECRIIWTEMEKLKVERQARYMNVGSNRRIANASA